MFTDRLFCSANIFMCGFIRPRWWKPNCHTASFKAGAHKPRGDIKVALPSFYMLWVLSMTQACLLSSSGQAPSSYKAISLLSSTSWQLVASTVTRRLGDVKEVRVDGGAAVAKWELCGFIISVEWVTVHSWATCPTHRLPHKPSLKNDFKA